MVRRPAFLFVLLLLGASAAYAQIAPEDVVRSRMRAFDGEDTPGAVVGVFRGGELVYAEGFGMASLEFDVPNRVETAFNIASVSKQFTAFAIVLLESRGLLSIDDEIHEYLPELPDFGHPITIRQMLNHTSGLRSLHAVFELAGWRADDRRTNEDLWRLMLRQKELNFEPGSGYMYCNTGYMLAAMIVERLTGERFADWMQANVFRPLGMDRTSVQDDYDRVYRDTAVSYDWRGDRWAALAPYWAYYGSGNIHTTVADLAKWAHNFSTGAVGGRAAVARMTERGLVTSGDTLLYALGVEVRKFAGQRLIQHGGAIGGYRSMLFVLPDLDAGVVIIGNNSQLDTGAAGDIARAFFDELEPAPPAGERIAGSRQSADETPSWVPTSAELDALVGRYYSEELDTAYEIRRKGDGLVAWHMRHGELGMEPVEPGLFNGTDGVFSTVRFNPPGRAGRGLELSNGRARHLWFERK